MILYCDGASRGNPGPSACGFIIFEGKSIVAKQGMRLGIVTNNIAEYEGLIRGLRACLELGGTEITVKSDSELLVRQLNGAYKVRSPHLLPLFKRAKEMLAKFESQNVVHIPREQNTLADALANEALDR